MLVYLGALRFLVELAFLVVLLTLASYQKAITKNYSLSRPACTIVHVGLTFSSHQCRALVAQSSLRLNRRIARKNGYRSLAAEPG